MLACVARHDKIWNGESIEISKCRRLDGSVVSAFESLNTILEQGQACAITSNIKNIP